MGMFNTIFKSKNSFMQHVWNVVSIFVENIKKSGEIIPGSFFILAVKFRLLPKAEPKPAFAYNRNKKYIIRRHGNV